VVLRSRRGLGVGAVALLATLTIFAAMAGGASARGLKTGFIDDEAFASPDSSVRAAWLDRAKSGGAGLIRINVDWRSVAGSKPLLATNPADPAYDFGSIDSAVRDARARGLDVMLTAYDAPDWATGKNRPNTIPPGAWKPDPNAFGQFGQALAKRYSGGFLGLPRVRYFEAWNEPNLSNYLAPQWKGKAEAGPARYVRMLNSFYSGVHKGQQGAKVIGGVTSPFGDSRGHPLIKGQQRMRPLVFLRNLFCLKRNLKPSRCKSKPHLDVLSHHPVNILNSPKRSAVSGDDVEIADFHKVRKVLHAAEHAKHVRPGGHHPLWATEIWWITDPPNRIGVSTKKQAKWLEQGLYLLWKQGASVVLNYEIRDIAYDPGQPPRAQVTSGVFFHNGKKKPAYRSFRFPFVTHRKSKHKVAAWGKAPQSGKLQIQVKKQGKWRTKKKLNVHQGRLFKPSLRLRGGATLRASVGHSKSLPWHQGG
jgi:hypothetical protein